MPSKLNAKEMLLSLLVQYEKMYLDNMALKAILTTSPSSRTRQTWIKDFEELRNDATYRKRAHEQFAKLYAHINALTDEADILELLSKIPLTEKVN